MLTIFVKKLYHRPLTGSSTSLRLYVHPLFILGTVLNSELHILSKAMFTGTTKCIYDPIKQLWWIFFFVENLSKLIPRFSKSFIIFSWESAHWLHQKRLIEIWNCSHKVFSQYRFQTRHVSWLRNYPTFFLLTLCDNFLNLAWI